MTVLVCWVVFPVILVLLALGAGLLLEAATGERLPGVLLPPAGLAGLTVVAQLLVWHGATAELATPAMLATAAAGFVATSRWSRPAVDRWAIVAAVAVLAVFAAPFVLSGEATFGGYIRLDDTASWLALTDRVMQHGPSFEGLAPSSYEATLEFYLGSDYPVGVFLPLGAVGSLVGQDLAWLYQPYIATLAALLALCLYALAVPLVATGWRRALVAVLASQPALLFGYALWGGAKELAAALGLALLAALAPAFLKEGARSPRRLLPLVVVAAATLAVLSSGGAVWLAPILLVTVWLLARSRGVAQAWRHAVAFTVAAALLSLPALLALGFLSAPAASTITDETRLANLIQPLSLLQAFGVWPSGDFRLRPDQEAATYVLVVVVGLGAVAGAAWAWKRRARGLLLYLCGAVAGCLLIIPLGSPWVDAKALAIASPALMLAALIGVASFFDRGWRAAGVGLGLAVAGGVLWSNVLAYGDVSLAPRDRFVELEQIGERFAGDGPLLMTEYEPYGVRYFLRSADPEGASELRRRPVTLRSGRPLGKAAFADLDEFRRDDLLVYRTIVLRRSPAASRPPSPYELVWQGRYYTVWQRPPAGPPGLEHLPLGNRVDPAARAGCSEVLRLARRGRGLAAVRRKRPLVIQLADTNHPPDWRSDPRSPGVLFPTGAGTLEATLSLPGADRYGLWIGGSVRGSLEASIDGRRIGSVRHELSHSGQYIWLGEAELSGGPHRVTLSYGGADLHPGSGGDPYPLGPLILSPEEPERQPITYGSSARARALCGKRLDWVEALSF
jgi:hypothetical protein